jgi:hypothetical protein
MSSRFIERGKSRGSAGERNGGAGAISVNNGAVVSTREEWGREGETEEMVATSFSICREGKK